MGVALFAPPTEVLRRRLLAGALSIAANGALLLLLILLPHRFASIERPDAIDVVFVTLPPQPVEAVALPPSVSELHAAQHKVTIDWPAPCDSQTTLVAAAFFDAAYAAPRAYHGIDTGDLAGGSREGRSWPRLLIVLVAPKGKCFRVGRRAKTTDLRCAALDNIVRLIDTDKFTSGNIIVRLHPDHLCSAAVALPVQP